MDELQLVFSVRIHNRKIAEFYEITDLLMYLESYENQHFAEQYSIKIDKDVIQSRVTSYSD